MSMAQSPTDEALVALATRHLAAAYGDAWVATAMLPLSEPDGLFCRAGRSDGVGVTGGPAFIFAYRAAGRCLVVSELVLDPHWQERARSDKAFAAALAVPDMAVPFHREIWTQVAQASVRAAEPIMEP